MIQSRNLFIFLALLIFSAQNIQAQNRLDLSASTLFIDGSLAVIYKLKHFTNSEHTALLETNIGGGFFVMDNLAVGIGLPIQWNFLKISTQGTIGLKLFSTYYFDIESAVFPYMGANIVPKYNLSMRGFQLGTGLDIGVLISMSEYVALDLGIKPTLNIKINDKDSWALQIPAGFLGVKGYF